MPSHSEIPFQRVLTALLDPDRPFPPGYVYRFSDMEPEEAAELERVWEQAPAWRRQALMEDIETIGEDDYLLSFEALSRLALNDPEGEVRRIAIRTLWDYGDKDLALRFIQMAENDADVQVRAAAATGLGRYVYDGELEIFPPGLLRKVEATLLDIVRGEEDDSVRRMALEALGFSGRDEVPPLIEQAFKSGDTDWIASALFAMGRSASSDWQPHVLSMLEHKMPAIRMEAARAAGELEIADALPYLFELLDDTDEDTRLASIWSLSQIGGEGVREALERLQAETEDEEEVEILDEALDNLSYTEEVRLVPLFDLPEEDADGELDEEDDWYDDLILDEEEEVEDDFEEDEPD